jgi:hypothetical protein
MLLRAATETFGMQPALAQLSFRAVTIWRDVVLSLQIEPQKMTISTRLLSAAAYVLLPALSVAIFCLMLCAPPAVKWIGAGVIDRDPVLQLDGLGSDFLLAAAGVTSVPDEGSTLLLLGGGILGLFLVSRRLRK